MYNRVKQEIRWHIELVDVLVISLAIVCFLKYPRFYANRKHSKKPFFSQWQFNSMRRAILNGKTPANNDKTVLLLHVSVFKINAEHFDNKDCLGALTFIGFVPIFNILSIYCLLLCLGFKPNSSPIGYHLTADGRHPGYHLNCLQPEDIVPMTSFHCLSIKYGKCTINRHPTETK